MKDSVKKLITIGLWTAIVLFILRYLITKPTELYDIFGCVGEAIGISVILVGFYERFLWKHNPFEKTPRIAGVYAGVLEYEYHGASGKKDASIKIQQTLLTVNLRITTDEITSNTVVSSLIKENEESILYYTYVTNPKSKYSKDNPIKYGTCRLIIDNKNELHGIYWTSGKTNGDITLKRSGV